MKWLKQFTRNILSVPLIGRPISVILARVRALTLARRIDELCGYVPKIVVGVIKLQHDHEIEFRMSSQSGKDQVARAVHWHGGEAFEQPLPKLVALLARASDLLLDVGANTGIYSLIAAASDPNILIYAFEPVPEIVNALEHNVELNSNCNRIDVRRLAVAESVGNATLYIPLDRRKSIETSASLNRNFREQHEYSVDVATVTIDAVCNTLSSGSRLLIKADVEGAEETLVMGSIETLRRLRPIIAIEMLQRSAENGYEKLLEAEGYMGFALTNDQLRELERIEPVADSPNLLLCPQEKVEPMLQMFSCNGFKCTRLSK
ncbi:hypothetical protein CKO42_02945 [Lamprobacter modestohalophilus]|uniref:Methyltransferase FkbM domain-containing protein n=1 Tax=Lamprobacter modestohalophilus TaxID=1064514 RepID=A0A9X1B2Y9_9GAMM|nr:FkbM family methyltransferase [Lamprobacter modestohalophilus]MBK1617429.1 hypothetical protein [Lamprobacter modestohalophilus]